MRKAAFIYEEQLSRHILRTDHALQHTRLQYTYELLEAYGAFQEPSSRLVPPRMAQDKEILTFHTNDYLEAVKSLSRGENKVNPTLYNFSSEGDNPPYPGMYEASALAVGATLVATELVASGEVEVAFNISGGLHHAAPNFASGFCIFNDVVIAINHLLSKGLKVAYIDIDAHHGDGVQDAYYSTNKVLTISLHEWGKYLFPGTGAIEEIGNGEGKGYNVNLHFTPYTDDQIYLWAFREVVPPLIASFQPDIVVTQLGCDTHYLDPLTHLLLTVEGYTEVIKEIKKLAPRWIALGGGGYEMGVVARAWTSAYGAMTDRELPDEIPQSYQELYGLKKLGDECHPTSANRQDVLRFAEKSVAQLKKLVFPYHKL